MNPIELENPAIWLLTIDIFLVTIALLHMLYHRRSPQSLSTWLLTIILLPYIGVIIYFIFGLRKSYSKRYKNIITQKQITHIEEYSGIKYEIDQILNSNNLSGTSEHNHVELITSDTDAFDELMQHIDNAQTEILLESYIFEADQTGLAIIDALCKKAKQGVKVRVLIDAIGSFGLYTHSRPLQPLRQAGGDFAFFQPIWPNIITNQINLRNHRKIYLFDQHTVFTGGLNLTNDYMGAPQAELTRWEDLFFKISGPALYHYQNIFKEDWLFATGELLESAKIKSKFTDGHTVQTIPAGPDIESDALYETLLHAIYNAKQHIRIATPYFIPNNNVMNALLIAVKRGIQVEVLTPTKSDHWLFDFGRSSYMRELVEAGGHVFYFPQNMLHAKLILIDDELAISGSANFDYRSLFINYEMVHLLYCHDIIKKLQSWFKSNLQTADIYQPKSSRLTRFIENISRIIAPIL